MNQMELKWHLVSTSGDAPSGLSGHSLSFLGNRLFLFGGLSSDGYSNDLFTFDEGMSSRIVNSCVS